MNSTTRARVVVLAGPSGSGKSRLAARLHGAHGWPVVRLDDFYRDGTDPRLPMRELGGTRLVDWDDPGSWDADAAVGALRRLVVEGTTEVPRYDIARSAAVGTDRVSIAAGALVLAEGIFAAEIIGRLGDEGLLHSAWCVRHHRWLTFVLRLVRDLSERRKAPHILLRRGLALCRDEPRVIARMGRLGARCATPREATSALAGASADAGGPR
ncbi:AAA family ATPase [Lapillicoccus sp.]|uniref:uridine kinase family protein n=1 Tax=Lapillicoccus sp. TaxID=1909287 RepID=UPI0025DA692B|nr:AAA family ATPase [Lapillicoccus sp.]